MEGDVKNLGLKQLRATASQDLDGPLALYSSKQFPTLACTELGVWAGQLKGELLTFRLAAGQPPGPVPMVEIGQRGPRLD